MARLLSAVAFVGVLSACQADVAVRATVEEDGSGIAEATVTLDAEAAAGLLDLGLDSDGLPLSDLAQSGWVVEPPEAGAGGETVIRATKEFGTTGQFAEVMAEISGPEGIFHDFELTRSRRFAGVDYTVEGVIDTTRGFGAFSDPALEAALGQPLDQVAATYGAGPGDVSIHFDVVLPGQAEEAVASTAVLRAVGDTTEAGWEVSLAADEVTPVAVASGTRQVLPQVLRGVAVVAAVLAVLSVFARLLRVLLPERRRRPPRRHVSDVRPVVKPEIPSPRPVAAAEQQALFRDNAIRIYALP